MTHIQYYRIKNAISSGKYPYGIETENDFNEFRTLFADYMEHLDSSTENSSVANALMNYGIPMDCTSGKWNLHYVNK